MLEKIKSWQFLNPLEWKWRHYLFAILILMAANILGPRGIIQLILLHQEKQRINHDIEKYAKENLKLKYEINRFKNSREIREKALRENLSLLKEDEFFIEFSSPQKKQEVAHEL